MPKYNYQIADNRNLVMEPFDPKKGQPVQQVCPQPSGNMKMTAG